MMHDRQRMLNQDKSQKLTFDHFVLRWAISYIEDVDSEKIKIKNFTSQHLPKLKICRRNYENPF